MTPEVRMNIRFLSSFHITPCAGIRADKGKGSLYLSTYGILLPRRKHWGLTDRRFHGRSQTECQRGSSGLFTCKARTVARATEPVFRKAGHDRRLP